MLNEASFGTYTSLRPDGILSNHLSIDTSRNSSDLDTQCHKLFLCIVSRFRRY